jgi:hypothetical protein
MSAPGQLDSPYPILIEAAFSSYGQLLLGEREFEINKRSFLRYRPWRRLPYDAIETLSPHKPHLIVRDGRKRLRITLVGEASLKEFLEYVSRKTSAEGGPVGRKVSATYAEEVTANSHRSAEIAKAASTFMLSKDEKKKTTIAMLLAGISASVLIGMLCHIGFPSSLWTPYGVGDVFRVFLCFLLFIAVIFFLLAYSPYATKSDYEEGFRTGIIINPGNGIIFIYLMIGFVAFIIFIIRYFYLLFQFCYRQFFG